MLTVGMADNSDDDPPPEWITHTEHIQALWRSVDPLHQILANIKDLDGTLCSLGQLLKDEHTRTLKMIKALADTAGPMAAQLVTLLEPMAYSCLPTLIFNMHTACRVLAHARLQVQSYPDLVDHRQAVPRDTGANF